MEFIVLFALLGMASASIIPYGGMMPYGIGVGAGLHGSPYYGYPMMGHGGFSNGMSHYAGDGRHYGGLYSNGLAHSSLGAMGAMSNGGQQGFADGRRYANQQQGLGGYHSNNAAANFNSGAGGFSHGNGFQDMAGRDNMGGFYDGGHAKGHKTTGFHKSYHNVETGRDTKYVDEDHDVGSHNMGQEYGNQFANAQGAGFNGANANGQHGGYRNYDQMGQHGLAGGSFNGANFGAHGANNYYNGQDMNLRDAHLANNMNHFGQGYSGAGNSYGMGHGYMHPW